MTKEIKDLTDVILYMKENKINPLIVDSWQESLLDIYVVLKESYKNFNNFNAGNYFIRIEHSHEGGQSPYEYRLYVLKKF